MPLLGIELIGHIVKREVKEYNTQSTAKAYNTKFLGAYGYDEELAEKKQGIATEMKRELSKALKEIAEDFDQAIQQVSATTPGAKDASKRDSKLAAKATAATATRSTRASAKAGRAQPELSDDEGDEKVTRDSARATRASAKSGKGGKGIAEAESSEDDEVVKRSKSKKAASKTKNDTESDASSESSESEEEKESDLLLSLRKKYRKKLLKIIDTYSDKLDDATQKAKQNETGKHKDMITKLKRLVEHALYFTFSVKFKSKEYAGQPSPIFRLPYDKDIFSAKKAAEAKERFGTKPREHENYVWRVTAYPILPIAIYWVDSCYKTNDSKSWYTAVHNSTLNVTRGVKSEKLGEVAPGMVKRLVKNAWAHINSASEPSQTEFLQSYVESLQLTQARSEDARNNNAAAWRFFVFQYVEVLGTTLLGPGDFDKIIKAAREVGESHLQLLKPSKKRDPLADSTSSNGSENDADSNEESDDVSCSRAI